MDYTTLVLEHQLEMKRGLHDILFEQMETESQFILSCLENMYITMEAVATKKEIGGFVTKIVGFIKKIFETFTNTAKKIFQTNQAWMDENLPKLEKINYGGLEMEMVPFWNIIGVKSSRLGQEINKVGQLMTKAHSDGKYKSMDTLKNDHLKNYLDENGELAAGFKNFIRTGNAKGPIKTVKLAGDALKQKVLNEFTIFCKNYNTTTVSTLKKGVDEVDHLARLVENEINKRDLKPTAESFCSIEGMSYNKTDLAYCENFIVLEAEQPADQKKDEAPKENNEGNKTSDKKEVKPGKAQLTDHGDANKAAAAKDVEASDDDSLIANKNCLSVLQTFAAAQMTVHEEAFHAYMDAMKQIIQARGKSIKEDNKKEAEQKPQETVVNKTKKKNNTK